MSLDILALTSRYHEALNHYDEATVRAMFAPDAVYVSKGVNGRIEGRDAILTAFTAYFHEHPDQYAEDEGVEILSAHAVRFAWRLEQLGVPFLYYEDTEGGHAGTANLGEIAHEQALEATYLARRLVD